MHNFIEHKKQGWSVAAEPNQSKTVLAYTPPAKDKKKSKERPDIQLRNKSLHYILCKLLSMREMHLPFRNHHLVRIHRYHSMLH